MLRELKIENLVIIDSARLEWREGFTAVTGETGAGKSVLMNALKFILGAKVKPDMIRRGEDRLRVEAVFDMPASPQLTELMRALELDPGEGELNLQRELTAAGRNRCRVNGTSATLADLEALGSHLVDLHGQHLQQSLLDARTHLGFLDAFARLDEERENYARLYRQWRDLAARIRKRRDEARRVREQLDFLQYQHKELEKARLSPGVEEKIEEELRLQAGMEKITRCLQAALALLEGEEGDMRAQLGRLRRELDQLDRSMGRSPFSAYADRLDAAHQTLADLAADLRGFTLPESADAAKLDQLNARLALIQRLKAKYHVDLGGLMELRDRRGRELEEFSHSEADIEAMEAEERELAARLSDLAAGLSQARIKAAGEFDRDVNGRLADLGMEGSRFATLIQGPVEGGEGLTPTGRDCVEFFLSSNAGEEAKALGRIASGGELSRIMLAIKTVLAAGDPRPLLVFDELDTGIGGTTANRVGLTLKELARHHQVIVITHLHQVAALAEYQQRVVKEMEGGRTVTKVIPLEGEQRVRELARMMGDETSRATRAHAQEILTQK